MRIYGRRAAALCLLGSAAFATGCAGPQASSGLLGAAPSSLLPKQAGHAHRRVGPLDGSAPITHVVIIIQENRTVDNLFNSLPGANTVQSGANSLGKSVALRPEPLTAPYDLSHRHSAWRVDYANGSLNGFNVAPSNCTAARACPGRAVRAYAYVPQSEVQPYYDLAEAYAFGDQMFATNQGPSFPAHQYLISGTSAISDGSDLLASENPTTSRGKATGGCDSPAGSKVTVIDPSGNESQKVYPCFQRTSLMQELDNAGLSWRYYQEQPGPGLWNAVNAIQPLWQSDAANVISPSEQVLTDISNGNLANVTWITPSGAASDHAGRTDGSGPSWVTSIVNAIGQSQYWGSTAIFVTWDDWGGWYDHVQPPLYNSYELGFRVPLLVISPYAKPGYISHVQHEFGSILRFTEENFGLPSLGTTDARADDLSDCFNFWQARTRFHRIAARLGAQYFRKVRHSKPDIPDTDY
ncbi:MAG TPA: alkaline phosphatase family protein [Candidatus Cybelea sp.]|jgi:phospholipase C